MKIKSKDYCVQEGEEVDLNKWPTLVKPLCKSKNDLDLAYPNTTATRRQELKSIRKLLKK
jgi:hypothetical protein